MYCKRILILQQTNARFAERGKELCGLVKFVNNGRDVTDVTVFVTNADVAMLGEWWLLCAFNREPFAVQLTTLNNCVFSIPQRNLDKISCLLVKKEDRCFEAARAYLEVNACDALYRQMDDLTKPRADEQDPTAYEQFVASTQNFYPQSDVRELKLQANNRYRSVSEYSDAFERFYASGGHSDYYDSVKREIGKVFVQFPPYYPLIRKYRDSFFVRIDFPKSDEYFVLGVLQKEGVIRYICYGLPAERDGITDKDFVYVDNSPTAFWMLFQDADSGQISAINGLV